MVPLLSEVRTGLFVDSDKRDFLLQKVQDLLRINYHINAYSGPLLPNRTCEILLSPFSPYTTAATFVAAKVLLVTYLNLINKSKPKMVVEKKPEIIYLDESDDETKKEDSVDIIDLEESDVSCKEKSEEQSRYSGNLVDSDVIFVDYIEKDNSPSKSPSLGMHSSDINNASKKSIQDEQISEEERWPNKNIFNSDAITVNSTKSDNNIANIMQDLNHYGQKRKKDSEKEDDLGVEIVEILDDEVIVLDDSFTTSCYNQSSSMSSEPGVSIVETSRDIKTTHKIAFQPESVSAALPERNNDKLINSLGTSSKPSIPPSNNKLTSFCKNSENDGGNKCMDVHSPSSEPAKKKSKLSYKRPAHLITPLVQPSSAASAKVDSISNIYNPNGATSEKQSGLRPIVIDGNNVAISHGRGHFSLKGIQICVNFFEKRGHRQIKVFIPQYRRNKETHDELHKMERQGTVVITPSRKVNGKVVASYDDRYIVQYAAEFGGIIVSTDNFRDLLSENSSWRETIEKRLLMFTWVDDLLMFPQDPLGRNGPSLDEFLKFPDT